MPNTETGRITNTVVLRFCATCGALLRPEMGTAENPDCENCGELIDTRLRRIEGTFSIFDARLMEIAFFNEIVSMFPEEKPDA